MIRGSKISPDTGVGVFGGETVRSGVSGCTSEGRRVAPDGLSVIWTAITTGDVSEVDCSKVLSAGEMISSDCAVLPSPCLP